MTYLSLLSGKQARAMQGRSVQRAAEKALLDFFF